MGEPSNREPDSISIALVPMEALVLADGRGDPITFSHDSGATWERYHRCDMPSEVAQERYGRVIW